MIGMREVGEFLMVSLYGFVLCVAVCACVVECLSVD